jgi:imidazolonepropionase
MWDSIWLDAHLATLRAGKYGSIRRGALAVQQGRIAWVGARADLPGEPERLAREVHACGGRWLTPGLIDCHTQLVHAGSGARAFELRLQGASDAQIAQADADSAAIVRATREASEMELIRSASARLARLLGEGVTAIDIRGGYGGDAAGELKLLRVARLLGESAPLTVKTTFFATQALPPEYRGGADAYIDCVAAQMLPAAAAAGLVDAVDVSCAGAAFTREHAQRLCAAAAALRLPLRRDAAQLVDAGLAAGCAAVSIHHPLALDEAGAQSMAASGTIAVLLPGRSSFLGEPRLPPIDALRRHGVPMALATGCNPESAPATSILLMLNLACTLYRLTPEEALAGVTCHAARVLGLESSHGTLEVGKEADFVLWEIGEPAELAYAMGANPCTGVVKRGELRSAGEFR